MGQLGAPKHTGQTMFERFKQELELQGVSMDGFEDLTEEDRVTWAKMAEYYRPYDHD